jgi:hypothetical protein
MLEPNGQGLKCKKPSMNSKKNVLWIVLLATSLAGTTGCGGFTAPAKTSEAASVATIHLTTTSLPVATAQSNYAASLGAAGGVPPYVWVAPAGHLPAGLTLTPLTGEITGMPTTPGTFSFTATVQDSKKSSASAILSVVVASATPMTPSGAPPATATVATLQITTTAVPTATVNRNYNTDVAVSGGVAPYAWSLASGHLPAGMTLTAATGAITGTPSSAGTFAITTAVQDSKGAKASAKLSVNVSPAPAATPAPSATGRGILATPANTFIDSIGVATHWTFPSYVAHGSALQDLFVRSGIRHFRDGANLGMPAIMQAFGSSNVKATLVIDPAHGIVPNMTYWSASPPGSTVQIADFIKNYMPANSVEALEMPNELDVFHYLYKWHPSDSSYLSTDPSAANYYGAYGEAVTKDCWQAIKSDPALASIKIIGPTVGVQVPSPYSARSLYNYVDWGGFHPYPGRANTFTYPQPYDTIQKYYWNSFEPSVNVSSDPYGGNPLMFTWYQPAFANGGNARPMAATETGYQTAPHSTGGVSVTAQAKYLPRLFAEYFRDGVARTFIYEFYDEGTSSTDQEQNFGLINNDLTPKPAYTALANLIHLLAEEEASFTPDKLNYSFEVQPNGAFVRTAYVHDLLLEKSDGDFYLLLWHEVSDTSNTDMNGNALTGAQRDPLVAKIGSLGGLNSVTRRTVQIEWSQENCSKFYPSVQSLCDER